MRPSNKQRSRNKSGNNNNNGNNQQRRPSMGNIINRVFESAGPDGKVRGTPQQIIDKYQLLARDAQLAGDRVAAESYLQHAEHYSRLLGDAQRQQQENNRFNQERDEFRRDDEGGFRDGGQPGGQLGGQQGGPREDGEQRRYDDGFERRPQPQMSQPVASGLAMIEPDDSFDMAGPIETPEGRRHEQPQAQPAAAVQAPPVPQAQPMLSPMMPMMPPMPEIEAEVPPAPADAAAEAPAEAPAEAERPAKRPRTRRRAKPAEAADAAPEASPEPVPQAD